MRMIFAAPLVMMTFALATACNDDSDPTPSAVDAGTDDGAAVSCRITSGCVNGTCTCKTPGKEGTACCASTSTQPCTLGACDDVCKVCN